MAGVLLIPLYAGPWFFKNLLIGMGASKTVEYGAKKSYGIDISDMSKSTLMQRIVLFAIIIILYYILWNILHKLNYIDTLSDIWENINVDLKNMGGGNLNKK